MTTIDSLILEAEDPGDTQRFIESAFGLDGLVTTRAAAGPSSGFRGYSLSLVYEQPADVDSVAAAAVELGAEAIKPVSKSFWGYGGSLRAPDGSVWTLASSNKKNTAEPKGKHDSLVLLAGVSDVRASKAFYLDKGLKVERSFGGKYVEFATGPKVTLALQSRRAVAKNAGVDADGTGAHLLTIAGGLGAVLDPDGYPWE